MYSETEPKLSQHPNIRTSGMLKLFAFVAFGFLLTGCERMDEPRPSANSVPQRVDQNTIDRPWEQFGIDEAEFRRNVELSKERARKKFVSDLPQPRSFLFRFQNTILSVLVFIALFVYLNLPNRNVIVKSSMNWKNRRFFKGS